MNWQSPKYQEVKMDAEIGSYQPDGDAPPDDCITRGGEGAAKLQRAPSYAPRKN